MTGAGPGPLAGLSVLIVEDEFLIAVDVQRIVEDAGAGRTVLVNSIADARQRLAEATVDLVVLDMRLGEDDGGGLINELRDRDVPFVIASGFAHDIDSPAPILVKPYRDADLLDAVLRSLAKR